MTFYGVFWMNTKLILPYNITWYGLCSRLQSLNRRVARTRGQALSRVNFRIQAGDHAALSLGVLHLEFHTKTQQFDKST